MNKVVEIGRMVADPEIRYSQTENHMAIARFRVAVDRKYKKEGEPTADFVPCKAFGKTAEFIEKYFNKGRRIGIEGRLTSGSYTNQEGKTVYTLEVYVDNAEFVDDAPKKQTTEETTETDFMNIPEDINEELPFI